MQQYDCSGKYYVRYQRKDKFIRREPPIFLPARQFGGILVHMELSHCDVNLLMAEQLVTNTHAI